MARRLVFRKGALNMPPPTLVTMGKRRRPNSAPMLVYKDANFTPSPPIMSERDASVLANFRREMRACDERACECTCHCHAGPAMCYGTTSETSKDTETRFHFRQPNTAHKRAHRECPKEGREHNKK